MPEDFMSKVTNKFRRKQFYLLLQSLTYSASCAALIMTNNAYALPQGGKDSVVKGTAEIKTDPGKTFMQVSPGTDKSIINWDSFSITKGEQVHFDMSANQAVLNRVKGADKSQIDGILSAGKRNADGTLSPQGKLILINPNGIAFGNNAKVSVGSLVASTQDVADDQFLTSNNLTFSGKGSGKIKVEEGAVISVAQAGLAALVAPGIEMNGTILAKQGKVALASGKTVETVDLFGDGLINFAVTEGADNNSGNGINIKSKTADGEYHSGISTDAGQVLLTAKAASSTLDNLINVEGLVQAQTADEKKGAIAFEAENGGIRIANNSVLNTANQAGDAAGNIEIRAQNITVGNGMLSEENKLIGDKVKIDAKEGALNLSGKINGKLNNSSTSSLDISSGEIITEAGAGIDFDTNAININSISSIGPSTNNGTYMDISANKGDINIKSGSVISLKDVGTEGKINIESAGDLSITGTANGGKDNFFSSSIELLAHQSKEGKTNNLNFFGNAYSSGEISLVSEGDAGKIKLNGILRSELMDHAKWGVRLSASNIGLTGGLQTKGANVLIDGIATLYGGSSRLEPEEVTVTDMDSSRSSVPYIGYNTTIHTFYVNSNGGNIQFNKNVLSGFSNSNITSRDLVDFGPIQDVYGPVELDIVELKLNAGGGSVNFIEKVVPNDTADQLLYSNEEPVSPNAIILTLQNVSEIKTDYFLEVNSASSSNSNLITYRAENTKFYGTVYFTDPDGNTGTTTGQAVASPLANFVSKELNTSSSDGNSGSSISESDSQVTFFDELNIGLPSQTILVENNNSGNTENNGQLGSENVGVEVSAPTGDGRSVLDGGQLANQSSENGQSLSQNSFAVEIEGETIFQRAGNTSSDNWANNLIFANKNQCSSGGKGPVRTANLGRSSNTGGASNSVFDDKNKTVCITL